MNGRHGRADVLATVLGGVSRDLKVIFCCVKKPLELHV
jgi:hypothetical protein